MDAVVRKAVAFIVRPQQDGTPELLVYTWLDAPDDALRLPGGTLQAGETPEVALLRELSEEVGAFQFSIVRKLGVQRYFKSFIGKNVERHDFLVSVDEALPDGFQHADPDIPAGEPNVMQLHWIVPSQLDQVDEEHRAAINAAYVPEFVTSD